MSKLYIRFFHNNVKKSINNAMFDIKQKYMLEVRVFAKVKELLNRNNIEVNTYDITIPKPSYRDIHFDTPFPIPLNFHILKTIFLNRDKNILVCFEPPIVNPFDYMWITSKLFKKIYTFCDDLVDNNKYFKINSFQTSFGMGTPKKSFKKKKLIVLINSNKLPFFPFKFLSQFGKELYSERINAIEYFEKNDPSNFYLYGRGWNSPKKYNLKEKIFGFKKYKVYRGTTDDKWKTLSNFKFSICFENMADINGYITEKIFDCLKTKCVPVYWGAPNIEKYIPRDCYIDFRDFNCEFDKLLPFIKSMDEKTYNNYIKNMEKLMSNKKFINSWFEEGFARFFYEDVLDSKSK